MSGVIEQILGGVFASEEVYLRALYSGAMWLISFLHANFEGVSSLLFMIEDTCNSSDCPGSAYTAITAAWTNIGYMAHSDFIYLLTKTGFGTWAPLIYVVAAIGALMSVALNNPPRNYAWFFIGPGIYAFLVYTTEDVRGVSWRVGGEPQNMSEVWKHAETGLANTGVVSGLTNASGIKVNKVSGPSGNYPVAYPLVFLDTLFSATTDRLIQFIGIGRQQGEGGGDSNLAKIDYYNDQGPWHKLSSLKWGMVENIVGATARDPDIRDALITFLASECGTHFKRGIVDGQYVAAAQSKGESLPATVMVGVAKDGAEYSFESSTGVGNSADAKQFLIPLSTEIIPTPRSLVNLFNQRPEARGSFTKFHQDLQGHKPREAGRHFQISCSEYLWTIVQALRWEAGHAYHQLLRSAPLGFTEEHQLLYSLFYGWDVRKTPQGAYASPEEMKNYVKVLIFTYLVRNELMFAPQISEATQRFAPSEQVKSYSESYVRDQGSKAKAGELYNWAVLMPYAQGVITYLVLIGYPFAALLMIIPGYWKAFYTWITFFAWVKLWDVGFALVHTLERSVWGMLGNHGNMARVANMAIDISSDGARINVACAGSGASGSDLSKLCAVPDVTNVGSMNQGHAALWLDKALIMSGAADLDLTNGYYIYIMAALYFAVPAVTGQLVLGAKAGMASLATQAIGQNAQEAGGAAKSGAVGEANQRIGQVGAAIGQAATAKSYRKSGLAAQMFDTQNQALDAGLEGERLKNTQGALAARAGAQQTLAESYKSATGPITSFIKGSESLLSQPKTVPPGASASGTGDGTGGTIGFFGGLAGNSASLAMAKNQYGLEREGQIANINSSAQGVDAAWLGSQQAQRGQGLSQYGQRLGSAADFEAQSAAWEAKNAWGSQVSGIAGVYGANPGSLVGQKPTDMTGLAMSGNLGTGTRRQASYSGFGFQSAVNRATRDGMRDNGSASVLGVWNQTGVDRGGYDIPAAMVESIPFVNLGNQMDVAKQQYANNFDDKKGEEIFAVPPKTNQSPKTNQ